MVNFLLAVLENIWKRKGGWSYNNIVTSLNYKASLRVHQVSLKPSFRNYSLLQSAAIDYCTNFLKIHPYTNVNHLFQLLFFLKYNCSRPLPYHMLVNISYSLVYLVSSNVKLVAKHVLTFNSSVLKLDSNLFLSRNQQKLYLLLVLRACLFTSCPNIHWCF